MDANDLRHALRLVAGVLERGERTHPADGSTHWSRLNSREHTRRAMIHAEKFILGILVDHDDDELAHAATRLLLALELREREQREEPGPHHLRQRVRDLQTTLGNRRTE